MSRITLKEFKGKALQKNEVKKEYDLPKPEYDIKRKLIWRGNDRMDYR